MIGFDPCDCFVDCIGSTTSAVVVAPRTRPATRSRTAQLTAYYDVVALTPDVVALRPKPSKNLTWEEVLAAARRDPC